MARRSSSRQRGPARKAAEKGRSARRSRGSATGRRPTESVVPGRKIRYAVVGLGHIAQTAILPAFAQAQQNSALAALVCDDPQKLRKLSRRYGVHRVCSYKDAHELFASGEVDAVYIALPNSMHREYTERAARAGLHVLCEKPMAVTSEERPIRAGAHLLLRLHPPRLRARAVGRGRDRRRARHRGTEPKHRDRALGIARAAAAQTPPDASAGNPPARHATTASRRRSAFRDDVAILIPPTRIKAEATVAGSGVHVRGDQGACRLARTLHGAMLAEGEAGQIAAFP